MASVHDCPFSINIDNQGINNVTSAKFLGVYIDDQLSWKQHVAYISQKLAKSIGIISRIRHLLPKNILLNLYYSLIHPYLSYCNIIWASTYCTSLACLTTLQKRIIRIICNVPYRAHTKDLFISLGILPFERTNKLQVGEFMCRFHMRLLPSVFNRWFSKNLEVHSHHTRSSNKYHQISTNTTIRQHSIRIYGPLFWNTLPTDLTNVPTLYQFKKIIKSHLPNSSVVRAPCPVPTLFCY